MATDVKFDVDSVKSSMDKLSGSFTLFANTLKDLNSYISTAVNAGVDSAVFGIYGEKMYSIWNENASTFGDFHANFTAWSEVVSIIANAKQNFVVDTAAMYKNDGGNLDGIQELHEYKMNNETNVSSLSAEAKAALTSARRLFGEKVKEKNKYGGITIKYIDADDSTVYEYYDKNNLYVGKKVKTLKDKTYIYNKDNKKVDELPGSDEWYKSLEIDYEEIEKIIPKKGVISVDTMNQTAAQIAQRVGYRYDNNVNGSYRDPYTYTGGYDCGTFVSAVLEVSGTNPAIDLKNGEYIEACGGDALFKEYLLTDNGWEKRKYNGTGDLTPGDILFSGGHVAYYSGENRITHASSPTRGIKVNEEMYSNNWTYYYHYVGKNA